MIVADVLGPWHRVEVTDGETGLKRMEERRLPQFMHDVGISNWRDVTSQASAQIPPTPTLCVWRVWCDAGAPSVQFDRAAAHRRALGGPYDAMHVPRRGLDAHGVAVGANATAAERPRAQQRHADNGQQGHQPSHATTCHRAGTAEGVQPACDVCAWRHLYVLPSYVT